jgi:hypothetical protein
LCQWLLSSFRRYNYQHVCCIMFELLCQYCNPQVWAKLCQCWENLRQQFQYLCYSLSYWSWFLWRKFCLCAPLLRRTLCWSNCRIERLQVWMHRRTLGITWISTMPSNLQAWILWQKLYQFLPQNMLARRICWFKYRILLNSLPGSNFCRLTPPRLCINLLWKSMGSRPSLCSSLCRWELFKSIDKDLRKFMSIIWLLIRRKHNTFMRKRLQNSYQLIRR